MGLLTTQTDIAAAMRKYIAQMRTKCTQPIPANLGYKGGFEQITFYWSPQLGLWFGSDSTIATGRYWNPLGIAETQPQQGEMLSITCEINPPISGLNRRTQGAFDLAGPSQLWLLHRGRIGGGKPGVGRSLFFDNYNGSTRNVGGDTFAVVGNVNSGTLPDDVNDFVNTVAEIKSLV